MSETFQDALENLSQAMRAFGVSVAEATGALKAVGKIDSLLTISRARLVVKAMKKIELSYRDTPYTIEEKLLKEAAKQSGSDFMEKGQRVLIYGMAVEEVSVTIWRIIQASKEENRPTIRKLRE